MPIRTTAVLIPLAFAAAAQDCAPVDLDLGTGTGTGTGTVEIAGEGAACYRIDVAPGARIRIQVAEGDGVVLSVDGLIEDQDDYAFVADPDSGDRTHRIRVGPATPTEPPGPFVIRITTTDAPEAADGAWRVDEGDGRAGGLAWIGEEGGPSFALNCAADGARVAMTYDGLGTAAMARDDAEQAEAVIEIEAGDESRRHRVTLRRFDGFDRYWETSEGLTTAFLDDFASGSRMRLLDAEGASAGEVELSGSAAVREALASRCGL